jgi:uncharacterized membrane protein YphA (DoxX/SURF4 family)
MHTLSLFPSLLTFGLFAPLLLRLIVSYFLLSNGWKTVKTENKKWLAIPQMLCGVMLFVGAYTQAIVLIALVCIKLEWWTNRKTSPATSDKMMVYWLVGVILLSLLLTGPGAFAIDYPL